jgi:hypothetical protein
MGPSPSGLTDATACADLNRATEMPGRQDPLPRVIKNKKPRPELTVPAVYHLDCVMGRPAMIPRSARFIAGGIAAEIAVFDFLDDSSEVRRSVADLPIGP